MSFKKPNKNSSTNQLVHQDQSQHYELSERPFAIQSPTEYKQKELDDPDNPIYDFDQISDDDTVAKCVPSLLSVKSMNENLPIRSNVSACESMQPQTNLWFQLRTSAEKSTQTRDIKTSNLDQLAGVLEFDPEQPLP